MIYFQKNFGYKLIQYVSTIKHKKIKNRRDGRHCHWLISYGMTLKLNKKYGGIFKCELHKNVKKNKLDDYIGRYA